MTHIKHSLSLKIRSITTLIWCMSSMFLHAMEQTGVMEEAQFREEENVFDVVAREHLVAIKEDIPQPVSSKQKTLSPLGLIDEDIIKQLNPSKKKSFAKVCSLLKDARYWPDKKAMVDADVRHDLNILVGSHQTPEICLANQIPTLTTVGDATKCALLLQPLTKLSALGSRKRCVSGLIEQYEVVRNLLEQISRFENGFYSFWQGDEKTDSLYSYINSNVISVPFTRSLREKIPSVAPLIESVEDWMNKTEVTLTLNEVSPLVGVGAETNNLIPVALILWRRDYPLFVRGMRDAIFIDRYTPEGMIHGLIKHYAQGSYADIIETVGYGIWAKQEASWVSGVFRNLKENLYKIRAMQYKLEQLSRFVSALTALQETLSQQNNPELRALAKRLEFCKNPELAALAKRLQSPVFRNEESYVPRWGFIRATYQSVYECIKSCRAELLSILVALGELDFLHAAASLHCNHPLRYNQPVFAQLDHPWLEAVSYWNPFLNPDTAVVNSIEFGGVLPGNPRTVIVSGPNGKGKTTNTTLGLSLAVLQAQTLTMAPAARFVLTPFDAIITLIKTETNIALGHSLFTAVCVRSGQVLHTIDTAGGFVFSALDEPCSGATNDILAQLMANLLISWVGRSPGVLCVATTHFPKPTELPNRFPGLFENYQALLSYAIKKGVGSFKKDEDPALEIVAKYLGPKFAQELARELKEYHAKP